MKYAGISLSLVSFTQTKGRRKMDSNDGTNSLRTKYVTTFALYISNFLFGGVMYIIGPSRYDISDLVDSSFESVSYGQTIRSAGIGVGAIVAKYVYGHFGRQIGYAGVIFLNGVLQLITPFFRNLVLYLSSELLIGSLCGLTSVALSGWILEMWQENSNFYLQTSNFAYALGVTVTPLIVAPFLSDKNDTQKVNAKHKESHIEIPFSILAGLLIVCSIMFVILRFKVRYIDDKRRMNKEMEETMVGSVEKSRLTQKQYGIILVIMGMIFLCNSVGVEVNTFGFAATFAYCIPLGFTKEESAFFASAIAFAFAGGRLVCLLIARHMKARHMLEGSFVLLLLGNSLLLIFANNNRTMLWIAICLVGSGHSSIFPAFMAFLEERINVTTSICGYFTLASCLSLTTFPVIIGNFIQAYPLTYAIINVSGISICVLIFSSIFLLDRFAGQKPKQYLVMK